MVFDLEPTVTLPWLVRLRWLELAGQVILLMIANWLFAVALNLTMIGIEVGIMCASNIALDIVRTRRRWSRPQLIGAVMLLDTGLLTLLLMGSGGAANPFTVLYLVHITLSAIVLGAWWTTVIAALSLAGFGLLFIGASDHTMHHGGAGFGLHLQAMWAAFALAAALIAFFVGRVTRAISSQREQIARLRETNERNERVASVTRLAAGAAHELGSPLATIAVAAHEAKLHLAAPATSSSVVGDLELIALEVDRCQSILQRMAVRGSEAEADIPVSLAELADRIRDQLGEEHAHQVDLEIGDPAVAVRLPSEQLTESIVALINNALDATRSNERVVVSLAADGAGVRIAIQDRGAGIDRDVLARIGTPFFTTKGAGRGLGLGVFLARAFLESRGGGLAIESELGVGTRAVIHLPRFEPRSECV